MKKKLFGSLGEHIKTNWVTVLLGLSVVAAGALSFYTVNDINQKLKNQQLPGPQQISQPQPTPQAEQAQDVGKTADNVPLNPKREDSAVAAKELAPNPENITVINCRTLCGPHRYLVETAVNMAKNGHPLQEIKARVEELMDSAKSYLMPADFAYLRRGGRLSPLVSYVGQVTRMAPVMTQTDDGRQLTVAGIRPSFIHAIKYVIKALSERGIDKNWRIYISHGAAPLQAEKAHKLLSAAFPDCVIDILPLSPAFITQGGPECVAVQVIHN